MAIQTCKWEPTKYTSASDALDMVSRWFGMNEEQIAARCGRFVRGRNKGKVRGWVVYRKCREGGWCFPVGGVIRPGIIYAHFVEKYDDLGQVMNYASDKFVGWGSRVDTAYGHDPVAARAADAARVATNAARDAEINSAHTVARAAYDVCKDLIINERMNAEMDGNQSRVDQLKQIQHELHVKWCDAADSGDYSGFLPCVNEALAAAK